MINYEHLIYFVEAVKCQSFSRAAKNLNINPATFTVAVNALEREIGGKLLFRTSSGVFPTDTGRQLYSDAMEIIHTQKTWHNPDILKMPQFVDVQIGVITSVYNSIMPEVSFRAANAGQAINLIVKEQKLSELDAGLLSHQYRLAIRSSQPSDRDRIDLIARNLNLNLIQLGRHRHMVFFHPDNPLNVQSAITQDMLRAAKTCCTENSFYEHFVSRLYPEDVLFFKNQSVLLDFLSKSKEYVAVLNSILQYSPYFQGELVTAKPLEGVMLPPGDFYLFFPKDDISEEERTVVTIIMQCFNELNMAGIVGAY